MKPLALALVSLSFLATSICHAQGTAARPASTSKSTASSKALGPPTPETYFGHRMGADKMLLDWDRVVSYFNELAASSPRVQVRNLGDTTEKRPYIVAIISAPENLKQLDRYRAIQEKLADPRKTSEAEAEKLIAEGKTIVMITCSIHSTEVASTSTAVEYAYGLATRNDAKAQAILKDTILLLVPSQNPDGVDLVTRWYRKTVGTPYEGTTPPELYQKYVGLVHLLAGGVAAGRGQAPERVASPHRV
jgi:hypothetical protein